MEKIKIILKKSLIGQSPKQKASAKALGLRKINSFVIHEKCPSILGMINIIGHLVKVEDK